MHVNPVFLVIFFDNCPDMCLILAKPDHFLVLAALMGLCSAAQICSLKYICLSLGIIAVNIDTITDKEEIKYEISDFLYHAMVLMVEKGVTWEDITRELARR